MGKTRDTNETCGAGYSESVVNKKCYQSSTPTLISRNSKTRINLRNLPAKRIEWVRVAKETRIGRIRRTSRSKIINESLIT